LDFLKNLPLNLPEIVSRLIAIIISLAFHEWAHAYAAYKLGDPTARNLGRMTINPLAHIDIIGFLALLIVRFGWAKPVPINPRNFKKPRRDEIIVSVAGVCTNLLLAFIALGIGIAFGVLLVYDGYLFSDGKFMGMLVSNFVFINLALFVFNLIPVPPLDGYHVLQNLLIRHINYRFFAFIERYSFIILIVLLMSGFTTTLLSWVVTGLLNGMAQFFTIIGL
jgi:Zn-dependent protease